MIPFAVLRWLRHPLLALAGVGSVLFILWAVVVVPPRLIDTSGITDPAKRLDEINALRTTLAGVLGGLAVAAGAVVAALNFRETSRQNRALLELQRRGQLAERFTRAVEYLGQRGDEKLDVRIGAVYALEQIAQDSADLHWPIMEVLTAYLRQHARAEPDIDAPADGAERRPPSDHQAIATVIGRRRTERDPGQRLNLRRVSLTGVDWAGALLNGADLAETRLEDAGLHGAYLEGAGLVEAHLEGAELGGAHLEGAFLRSTHLDGANLLGARVEGASLVEAHLEKADPRGAHLERANLSTAHLEGADLREAHLERANLSDTHLERADLRGAHLERALLRAAHLDGANLSEAKGLTTEQLRWTADTSAARLSPDMTVRLAAPADDGPRSEQPSR